MMKKMTKAKNIMDESHWRQLVWQGKESHKVEHNEVEILDALIEKWRKKSSLERNVKEGGQW